MAPASLRKEGSQIDLAIAIGILLATGIIWIDTWENTAFIGELALDGSINVIEGVLPMVISLRDTNIKRCIIPYENKDEASVVKDMDIIPVKNLREAIDYLNGEINIPPYKEEFNSLNIDEEYNMDFSDIKGQEGLKEL